MAFSDRIYKFRKERGLSEAAFGEIFAVSADEVRSWEKGGYPEREKIMEIASHFGMTCDDLLIQNDYADYDLPRGEEIQPDYANIDYYDSYTKSIIYEYMQSIREGRDADMYNKVLLAFRKMPEGIYKEKIGNILFEAHQS